MIVAEYLPRVRLFISTPSQPDSEVFIMENIKRMTDRTFFIYLHELNVKRLKIIWIKIVIYPDPT